MTKLLLCLIISKKASRDHVEQRFISVEAIARDLDISPDLMRLWIRQKKLPAVKIGKEYRIKREDYERFLKERETTDDKQ